MKAAPIKRVPTLFLKAVIVLMGLGVLALCILALPSIWRGGSEEFPMANQAAFLIMIGMYATAAPFFVALWQTLKLLRYIDRNTAFSDASVRALRAIKYCAAIIAVLYVGGIPLLIPIAEAEDAPGLVVIGMVIACAPVAFAVFTAVLQTLLQSAIDMKSENDLTI